MCTCVAGGGSLCSFDFLTSLQSFRVSCPSLLALHVCRESLAWHAPLTPILDSILRMYCRANRHQPRIYSPRDLLFHKDRRIHFPALASFHSTIPRFYVLEPTCRHRSLNLSLLLRNTSINIRLPCRCHEVFFFRITVPFAPAIKIQTLTAMTGLPILTTKLCFERSSGQIT